MSVISLYWIILIIFTTTVFCCRPGEYPVDGVCCSMCSPGSVVRTHCTATSGSIVCVPCIAGTYMDHPNGLTKCLRCRDCDPGAGMEEKTKCTYTKDTVCDCKAGHFCREDSCDLCEPHGTCKPGQFVKAFGTTRKDTVCEACPPGHYSSESMSETCTPWTKCSRIDFEYEAGTPTSDSVCRRARIIILQIPIMIGMLITTTLIAWIIYKPAKNAETNECLKVYGDSHRPVQEQGAT